jgi:hypothetical protein
MHLPPREALSDTAAKNDTREREQREAAPELGSPATPAPPALGSGSSPSDKPRSPRTLATKPWRGGSRDESLAGDKAGNQELLERGGTHVSKEEGTEGLEGLEGKEEESYELWIELRLDFHVAGIHALARACPFCSLVARMTFASACVVCVCQANSGRHSALPSSKISSMTCPMPQVLCLSACCNFLGRMYRTQSFACPHQVGKL